MSNAYALSLSNGAAIASKITIGRDASGTRSSDSGTMEHSVWNATQLSRAASDITPTFATRDVLSLFTSPPRTNNTNDRIAWIRVRSIFSAHCFKILENMRVVRTSSNGVPEMNFCIAATTSGKLPIAASRTHEPTSPRLSTL